MSSDLLSSGRQLVILAEGYLDFHHGKTAVSILRYKPEDVVAVVDRKHAGATVRGVLGLDNDTPIVESVEDTFRWSPTAVLIGIAPRGGGLPPEWRPQLLQAVHHGLDIISGLHYMLNGDAELLAAARTAGVRLWDVRRPPDQQEVANLTPHRAGSHVVTLVGSDCAVGKMTAGLELAKAARQRGLSTQFVATGQTGIMLEGSGVPLDRVIGDFMAGAIERLVNEASERADWVFVEGQGSLIHPAYSGVTLALLHGSSPDSMVLVHQAGHEIVDDYSIRIPSLPRLVRMYEEAASWIKAARVVAIALNTRGMSAGETREAIAAAEAETGLPVADPVKTGGDALLSALVHARTSTES